MLTVHWQHIILAASGYTGTSRRIARMRNAGARFADPYRQGNQSGNTWTNIAPSTYGPPFSPADPFGDRIYEFEFWSINGSTSGIDSHRIVDSNNSRLTINNVSGQLTLNAKAWYIWNRAVPGDPGVGEPEVEIDAFDLTSNDFIPNKFVDIDPDGPPDPRSPDGLGTLAYALNEDGYISTAKLPGPIFMKAHEFESGDTRYEFSHWEVIRSSGSPTSMVNGSTITIPPGSTLKAYAFYNGYKRAAANTPELENVKDVLRPYALYDRAGNPFIIVGPLGDPQPPLPLEDVKRFEEMLHRTIHGLHKLYDS